MPHLRLEYTDNVEIDTKALFTEMHQQLVATGHVNMKGIRSAAIKLDDYLLADGYEGYKYVMVTLTLRAGRTEEVRLQIAQAIMDVLEKTFGHERENGYMSLHVDLQEMHKVIALKNHNIPAGGVQ